MLQQTHTQPPTRIIGIALVLTGATLWGVSGTVAQFLFQQKGFSPEWLVVIRLLVSGVLMLLFSALKEKKNIWDIWKHTEDRLPLLSFSLLGMLGVQYTYFAAIAAGNAATATVLQYLGPVFIMAFVVIKAKRLPTKNELFVIIIALLGTFLLVTNGRTGSLSLSGAALFWGISSAFALAFYTLQPVRLITKWGTSIIVGWGMLLGGIGFSFIHPPWQYSGELSAISFFALLFVILFGTLIAFFCYLESLRYITGTEASLLSCAEPLSAAFLSVAWLHVALGPLQWGGIVCILGAIVLLSLTKRRGKV